jgi:tetratricopeptide (TPR) repeat protein
MGLYHANQPKPDLVKGTAALQKALAINPGMIDASNWLHNILQASGKVGEANTLVMDMIQRDPLYRPGIRNAVNSFIWFGRQEEALTYLERIRPLIPNDAVIQSSEAAVRLSQGQTAEGLKLIESAVALQPTNSVARLTRSFAWMDSHQYERVAAEGEEWTQIFAMIYLGRTEEASILAFKRAEEQADAGTLFTVLNNTGRSDELIAYLEERWPDLDALRKDFPAYGGLGDFIMLDVALAYSRSGNQQRFDDAMQRAKSVHDSLKSQGVSNSIFWLSEAAYQALAGDLDASLEYLDRAVTGGAVTSTRMTTDLPMLAPLEGDPRFEAIQARMIEHLNRERAQLGLEPVST